MEVFIEKNIEVKSFKELPVGQAYRVEALKPNGLCIKVSDTQSVSIER